MFDNDSDTIDFSEVNEMTEHDSDTDTDSGFDAVGVFDFPTGYAEQSEREVRKVWWIAEMFEPVWRRPTADGF